MHRVLSIIIALLLIVGMASCSMKSAVEIGTVKIISGGVEYTPLQNSVFSLNKDGVAADSARIRPGERDSELPVIPYHDDLQVIIEGKTTGEQSYTLYADGDEDVYYRQNAFTLPDKPGSYIVSLEAVWGNDEEYEGYQYLFVISWPDEAEPDRPGDNLGGASLSYPKQAAEYLGQCLNGSAYFFINRAKDMGTRSFPGMNYSGARMSPNGNYILCKTDAYGAGEARWSGYSILDLTTNPMETYSFDGVQWGYQDHIFLSDEIIGFAFGGVVGGQEDTWESIRLFDNRYNPLDAKPVFSGGEDAQVVGIGYDAGAGQYVVAYAVNTAGGQEIPFSQNRLVIDVFGNDGVLRLKHEFSDEYMSPYSPNLLSLLPNNPAVTPEGQILISAMKREDVSSGDYSRKLLIVSSDWYVKELPFGESFRLSADGGRAFAAGFDDNGVYSPVILDFEGRAGAAVTDFPDVPWEVEGYSGKFTPIDAVMRDHHVYIMAENYTVDYDLFCGLFYWDGERAELLQVFPGRDYLSLAGVDGEGFCYVMLHGMCGDEYADQREYIKSLIG